MCAINGFNFKEQGLALQMNKVTAHRGPDGTGVFLDDGISLGHNRLSIIDPSESASQPMVSDDGRFVIIFNGEIYNFKELKKGLKESYRFKTNSDTEVILASYQKWGSDCVKKLNGMFAFAIWDKNKKELFLARDHIGIKPLYYFWDGKRFIFSSEVKAILEHDVPRKINTEALSHYFRILYVPEPLSMFENIYKLPPAHHALLKGSTFVCEEYWTAEDKREPFSDKGKIKEQLKEEVCMAVRRQLVSDKPIGVYLSGGIDSSIVLDSVARTHDAINTFSAGFDVKEGEERDKYNADFNLARRTAKHYGTKHHEFLLSSKDIPGLFKKVMQHTDDPVSNPTAIPMMELAGFAKQHVDVVLGGDGGDELFGGYERYRLSLAATQYQKLPHFFRSVADSHKRLEKLNTPPGIDRFGLFMFQKDNILSRVLSDELVNEKTAQFFNKHFGMEEKTGAFETAFMDIDRKSWLVDESLALSDKMSMSAGLEQRVPLLDKELVEFAARVPLKYKLSPFNTKIILKDAFKGEIPDFLFNQPKRGWFSPGAKWLRQPHIHQFAQEVLTPAYYSGTSSLFKWDEIEIVLENHCTKREYNLTILWALLSFQLWAKEYKITLS